MEAPETMTIRAASTFSGLARPRPRPTPVEQIRGRCEQLLESARSRLSVRGRTAVVGGSIVAVLVALVVLGPAALARVPRSAPDAPSDDPTLPPAAALPIEVGQAPPLSLPTSAGAQAPSTVASQPAEVGTIRPSRQSSTPIGPTAPTVVVHAAGAVLAPGVYRLSDPARVTDVVAAAGGLTGDADPDVLNLAARVGDGERIFVPRRGQAPPDVVVGTTGSGTPTGSSTGARPGTTAAVVDLNAASAEQLDALPGIGPAIAERIIEARTRLGRFRSVHQLLDVPGIGETKFSTLKPRVRV